MAAVKELDPPSPRLRGTGPPEGAASIEEVRRLRAHRRRLELTQIEVATAAGMSKSQVCLIELGRLPIARRQLKLLRQAIREAQARRRAQGETR